MVVRFFVYLWLGILLFSTLPSCSTEEAVAPDDSFHAGAGGDPTPTPEQTEPPLPTVDPGIPGLPLPPPPPPLPDGYAGPFLMGDAGFYLNAAKQFCRYINWLHYLQGGGNPDVALVPVIGLPEANWQDTGICPVRGFFFVQGKGHFGDEKNKYCTYSKWEDYINAKGPGDPNLVANLPEIPNTMVADGDCNKSATGTPPTAPLVETHFWVGNIGYYAGALKQFCKLISWGHYLQTGGNPDVTKVPHLTQLPEGWKDDGVCSIRGFFIVKDAIYYANELGHFCQFKNWDQYIRANGPPDTSQIATLPEIPAVLVNDGLCP